MNRSLLLLFILFSLVIGCSNSRSKDVLPEAVPGDFESFYHQFHNDTAFQSSHIIWPLSGRPSMLDSTNINIGRDFRWQRSNWVYHKAFDPAGNFTREFEVISDRMINEEFVHKNLPIRVLRRFAKTSDGWMLIYYAGPGN